MGALALALVGCQSVPEMRVGESCQAGGVPIEVELGVSSPCSFFAHQVEEARALYEARWGPVPLEAEGWVIRIRRDLIEGVDAGRTWHTARVVDVLSWGFMAIPHELRHVQLGASSGDHHGWCPEFVPWERTGVHYIDEGVPRC